VNSDSSLAINDSQNGVIQLDTSGNPTQITGSLGNAPNYSWGGSWYLSGAQAVSELVLPLDPDPADLWATPSGNPSQNGGPDALCPCLSQIFVDGNAAPEYRKTTVQDLRSSSDADLQTQLSVTPAVSSAPADCPICALTSPSCLTTASPCSRRDRFSAHRGPESGRPVSAKVRLNHLHVPCRFLSAYGFLFRAFLFSPLVNAETCDEASRPACWWLAGASAWASACSCP